MYRHRTKYIHFYEHSTRWEERYGDKFLLASPKIVIVARNGLLSLNYVTNTIKVVPDMAVLRNFCIPSHNIYIYIFEWHLFPCGDCSLSLISGIEWALSVR